MMQQPTGLEYLGYTQLLDTMREDFGAGLEQVARVIAEHKGSYEIASAAGEYRATVTGKRMLTASGRDDYPAVGDWVITKNDSEDIKVIEEILPRAGTLHKQYGGKDEAQLIAANVNAVFIVESLDRDYSLNRFERYLALAYDGGVKPIIVLNKSDLLSEYELKLKVDALHERFDGVDVLVTSTVTPAGAGSISRYMQKGLTYCFLGSSGVGKSSLINNVLANNSIKTKEIGQKSGRGRHTTTAREMYVTDSGSIIIDNPGSREVGLVDSGSGVKEVFTNIEKVALDCRFKDCTHANEPGCAVTQALSTGMIDAAQFENYKKLQKESAHYEASVYERRQNDKKFGKYIKTAKNELKKFRPK